MVMFHAVVAFFLKGLRLQRFGKLFLKPYINLNPCE
uniref:Uncharacterized protein n=1 Tax=Arundo donax TaxID=35708 RepID=A0A0A9GH57_ARUDO